MSGIRRIGHLVIFSFLTALPILPAQTWNRLVLSTADTVPFSTDRHDGFYDVILTEALNRLGIELEIIHLPSERSLAEARTGRVDGEFGRIEMIADLYPELQIVPEPIVDWTFSAFVREGTPAPRNFADLRDRHIAYIRGWKIYEDNVTEGASITVVSDEDQLFDMLAVGRVDVILYNRERGLYRLALQNITEIVPADPPLATRPMYLFLHSRHARLAEPIAMTLREMKTDGTYRQYRRQVFGT
jgi:polar amino acid transport system substrate-binding protein